MRPVACIFKPITIVNDDFSIVSKLEISLTGDARVVFYDRHMFTEQATDDWKKSPKIGKSSLKYLHQGKILKYQNKLLMRPKDIFNKPCFETDH